MLTPFPPAVLACPKSQRQGEKPERVLPPPYPEWPEIALQSNFYNLATLLSFPAIGAALYSPDDDYWDWNELISTTDFLKQTYVNDKKDLYLDILDTQGKRLLHVLPHLLPNVILPNTIVTKDNFGCMVLSSGSVELLGKRGCNDPEWNTFAAFHDLGHWQAWSWLRSTTTKFTSLASAIFDFLKPESVSQCGDFWSEFAQRNMKVVEYLENSMILEELRATLIALSIYPTKTFASIEADIRKELMEQGTLRLFEGFIATNASWTSAAILTILAELSDPENPIRGLTILQNSLMELQSCNWTKDQWYRWLEENIKPYIIKSKMFQRTWQVNLYGVKGKIRSVIEPSGCADTEVIKTDYGYHIAPAYPPVPYSIAEAIILESLRQQLAQPFGLGLVCPIKHKRGTCCGFGHYLRAVWEQVPLEYRYPKSVLDPQTGKKLFFRKPPKACLNYGLG
jgi:hypothetical protein